jgi:hypothetical protein
MRTLIFSTLLATGLVIASSPSSLAASPATPSAGVHVDPGLDLGLGLNLDALHLSTFTDTLPGDQASDFHALAGDLVRRVYVVRNDGLLPLTRVTVHDPDVSPSSITCSRHGDPDDARDPDDPELGPLHWTACSATFTALAGTHETTVTATATSPVAGRTLSAQDDAAYTAISPGLSASVTFKNGVAPGGSVPAGATIGATLRIVDSGSAEIAGLHATPPASWSGFTCPAGSPADSLGPGESVVCNGSLSTAPGRHDGSVIVSGRWHWDRPITSQGPQFARWYPIQVTADAGYVGFVPSTPPPSPPPAALAPPPRSAALARVPAATPPSPSASPPPSPKPSNSPTPAPRHALPPATAQFVASRGLSLPLKVLAIVVIPGVAAARRIVSRR